VRIISIEETFTIFPSSLGMDSVPMIMFLTVRLGMNLFLVISAVSTAREMARPLAFNITLAIGLLNWVITART
jgi:hypothetical protein